MNVPNQYKGFARLPEDVQRRMDPELAQKYEMGGAVMQRPLFRNMGGPAQPMAQDMAPAAPGPDPMIAEQLMQAERGASEQAMLMGQEYMANMESRLNAAETPEDVINAIRGNDLPMEARYQELAGLVGEADAMQTPETVLAMVQPTIMMTEQGALDSGIGELIQSIAGDVAMESPEGDATAMAGGVGSLMMAGAGNTPPQNFSQGGAVRLAQGGDPVQKYYEQRLPLYETIIGGGDDAKAASQAQALFAIADAAGRFASGVGAQGQDVRGLSPAAQLAAATTGLGGQLGAIGAQAEQADRSARLAALQAAESEYAADRAAARATSTRALGDLFEVVDKETGEVVATVPIGTTAEYTAVAEKYPNTTIRKQAKPKAASMQTMVNISDPTQVIAVDTNNAADYKAAIEGNFVPFADRKTIKELQNPDAKPMTLYSEDGVVTFNLALPEHQERYNALLNDGKFTADPTLYQSAIQQAAQREQFVFEQDIRRADALAAELRAQEYKIDEEDRAVLREIAKEEREQGYTISAEKRKELIEIAREERAVATQIEAELRAQDYAIAAEDRALVRQIASEERQLGRTLDAEDRAARLEELRFNRDQEAEIAQELRQQGYIQASEDREVLRAIAAEERALDRELDKEERAAIAEQLRFDRDQGAKIEAELRAQGYTIEAEERAFARAIAAEERALGRELDKEERKQRYDAFIFERDQSTAPVKGIPRELFNELDEETQNRIIAGDPKDPQTVKGIPRDIFDALTPDEQEEVMGLGEEPSDDTVNYQLPDGTEETVRKGSPREQELLDLNAKRISVTAGDYDILTDVDMMERYGRGETDATETAKIQAAIAEASTPKAGSNVVPPLPRLVQEKEEQRAAAGFATQIPIEGPVPEGLADNLPLKQVGGAAFGTGAFIRNIVNVGFSIFDLSAPADKTKDALAQVNALNESAKIAFRNMVPGRSQEAVNQFATNLPATAKIRGSKDTAASEIKALITLFQREVDQATKDLVTYGSSSERAKAEQALEQGKAIITAYEALLEGIQGSGGSTTDKSEIFKKAKERGYNNGKPQ